MNRLLKLALPASIIAIAVLDMFVYMFCFGLGMVDYVVIAFVEALAVWRLNGYIEHVTDGKPDVAISDRTMSLLMYVLAFVPLSILIRMILHYHVNVPYWDQWGLIDILAKSYAGTLTFHDLAAHHCEHSILFPRLIMVPLARLTHWNIGYELAVNVILATATFAVICCQAKRISRTVGKRMLWSIPLVSVLLFSLSQYENWLWGWQIAMFLNLLAVTAGFILLTDPASDHRRFAGAIALGAVATFSFSNGTLYWPIGLLVLALTPKSPEKRLRLTLWIVASAAALTAFVIGFKSSAQAQSYHDAGFYLAHLTDFVAYVFNYLGAPLSKGHSIPIGIAGIAYLAVWLFINRKRHLGIILPLVAMPLYSIGSAALTAYGRMGLGVQQAIAPRYITMSTPLWISIIFTLLITMLTTKRRTLVYLGATCLVVIQFLAIYSSIWGREGFRDSNRRMNTAKEYFLTTQSPKDLKLVELVFPVSALKKLHEYLPILKRHHLSLYANTD